MISGFNHNIQHKGRLYHIQTEDSGIENPHIITLLYVSGTIIAKKKTGYQDLLNLVNKEEVIRELMEEQHKSMLRELVRGGFDKVEVPVVAPQKAPQPVLPPRSTAAPVPTPAQPVVPAAAAARPAQEIKADQIASLFGSTNKDEKSLDEIILSYLSDDGT